MPSVIVDKNVEAKMRDGTVLRADVYRPAEAGEYPVLVQRTPYNKELLALTALHLDPIRAAANGFIVAIQDLRSRWASDGDVYYCYRHEFEDGADTIEWAATLPGSNGNVGALGLSHMGATAWHAAVTAPPALKGIAATTAPNDFWIDHVWRGGAFSLGLMATWSLVSVGPAALVRSKGGSPDFVPSLLQLVDDIDEFEKWVRFMPLNRFPPAHMDDETFLPFFGEILDHPHPDEFTRALGIGHRHADVRVPALIIGGWYDALLASDLQHYASMRAEAGTEEARDKTKLIIGPWSHGAFLNVVGDLDFGMRANGLFVDLKEDLTNLHLRWFNQRLTETATGIDDEPRVKLFVQGLNRWREEADWPLAREVTTPFYLGAEGGLGPEAPGVDEAPDTYVYDPQDPCPTLGGNFLMPRTYTPGPVDQALILDRSDVLTYTTAPLSSELEVTGHVRAVLYAATSALDTDWVLKLCVVDESGRTYNICDGILRASYADSLEKRTQVEPEAVVRYEIDLWATSIVIKANQRIQVLVTSSDFPRYDRNPNTGELGVEAATTLPARQRIFHDGQRASHVLLPVIPSS